jgi:hypothetical protein
VDNIAAAGVAAGDTAKDDDRAVGIRADFVLERDLVDGAVDDFEHQ